MALARGVGHIRNSSVRFPPLERVPEQARGVGQVIPLADGKNEEPFAPMGRTDFRRSEEARRKPVAHADQSCGDFGEAEAEMMGDVFEENERRFDLADDPGHVRPEMAGILGTETLPREGERLARVSRREDVHRTAPWAAVEGGNVVPDRRVIQGRIFHPRHEKGRGVGFPFDMAHSSISGHGEGKSEVDASGSGAEREAEEACVFCPVRQACGR